MSDDDYDAYDEDGNESGSDQNNNKINSYQELRKQKNRDEFHNEIRRDELQGKQLNIILQDISHSNETEILEELENIDLIIAIEYVPLEYDLLKNIIFLLKIAVEAEDERIVEIILESDQFKNLIYQMCLTIYDQNNQINFKEIVNVFNDLHYIFTKSHSLIDLRQSPIIFLIELIELVHSDYPKCELAALFDKYRQLKDSLKEYDYPNYYRECPVQPLMLEFDFKYQTMGDLQTKQYLNYHFFILREDYLREFREFIFKFKTKTIKKSDKQFPMYQEAQLIDFEISNKELIWTIKLKQYNKDGRKRKVLDWKKSKRLTSGALLAFTNIEGYPIVFGVIVKREPYQRDYNKYFEIQLSIKLLSRDIQQFLDFFKCTNIVIENPILYEVSTSYLKSLKSTILPFKDIIIKGSRKVEMPNYILTYNYKIHLQNLKDINNNGYDVQNYDDKDNNNDNDNLVDFQKVSTIMNLKSQQWQSQGTLDQSQMNALKLMLSAEIALIQGPPGTGKTYCGALAVRNILANVNIQSLPILVVCYTNHALDQFLNHILNYVDHRDVLRLGFGCKDPNIIPCMIKQEIMKIQFEWDKYFELKSVIKNLVDKILNQQYTVSREDILTHWPELHNSIANDESAKDINHLEKLFSYWLGCKIPPYQNSSSFYSDKCQLSNIKSIDQQKTLKYQSIFKIQQTEIDEDIDKDDDDDDDDVNVIDDADADEYLDSGEEEEARYFGDEFASNTKQNKYHQNQKYMITFVNKRIPYDHQGIADLQKRQFNPWKLNKYDIQVIKDYIAHLMLLQDIQKYSSLNKQFEEMSLNLKQQYQQANYHNFNSKKIIGVTITGAAKYTQILQQLNTKILVIEEAAEVLESHLISILTPNIQHLILIGDHQQLKPKLSCYELEQQYGANTSLFQKLFEQGILNVTLTCQRRMKPKFADFIRLIYDIISEEQINTTIDGMNSDLVYFNHSWLEERDANSTSTQNRKEALMIIELVIYLIGCQHKQKAMIIKKALLEKGLNKIKVQTVDNYQGEENEIVIVSLVRSNNNGKIGFVNMENRINVALSRARVGLYVFGNFKCIQLKHSPSHIWSRIIALAEQKMVLKDNLELCCLRHKKQRSAKTPEQMTLFKPGCCDQICDASYPNCTHKCSNICHIGDHLAINCIQKCQKYLACGHKCTAKCNFQCSLVECQIKVSKQLPCQHNALVECYKPEDQVFCEEQVSKSYPCGHTLSKLCSQPCDPCQVMVQKVLPCGHVKDIQCFRKSLQFRCKKPCSKTVCTKCNSKFTCNNLCSELCQPCHKRIFKELPCGHSKYIKCGDEANIVCDFTISKYKDCGTHYENVPCHERLTVPRKCEVHGCLIF